MFDKHSTAPALNSTAAQLAEQFPLTCDPFAVWYSLPEGGEKWGKWTINDSHGDGVFTAGSFNAAVKLSSTLISAAQPDESDETRAGAMACIEALRIIEHMSEGDRSEITVEENWRCQESAVTAMLFAAGKPNAFLSGFVATFAEYVFSLHCAGTPNLYVWQPEAAMTEEEKAADRAKTEAALAE